MIQKDIFVEMWNVVDVAMEKFLALLFLLSSFWWVFIVERSFKWAHVMNVNRLS